MIKKITIILLSFTFSQHVFAKNSFEGMYGGLELGVQSTQSSWSASYLKRPSWNETTLDSSSPYKFKSSSPIVGIHLGNNWVQSQYLYGVEIKVNAGSSKKQIGGIPGCRIDCDGYTTGISIDSSYVKFGEGISLNGKFGVLGSSDLLIYGLGGVSYQKITTSATCKESGPDPVCLYQVGTPYSTKTKTKNTLGISLGAGVEKSYGPYSLRIEFLHTEFQKISHRSIFDEGTTYDYSVKPKRQTLSLGINYYF